MPKHFSAISPSIVDAMGISITAVKSICIVIPALGMAWLRRLAPLPFAVSQRAVNTY